MSVLVQGALNGTQVALTPEALAREARGAVDAGPLVAAAVALL